MYLSNTIGPIALNIKQLWNKNYRQLKACSFFCSFSCGFYEVEKTALIFFVELKTNFSSQGRCRNWRVFWNFLNKTCFFSCLVRYATGRSLISRWRSSKLTPMEQSKRNSSDLQKVGQKVANKTFSVFFPSFLHFFLSTFFFFNINEFREN